ncbi:complement C1s subcomponent-like [Girardinichthys multiradiatus]|uniref:complement C1s subcomponent-like n=1 Tax=Girardinichthys multiradiatus TaxID=208333 RepID=UPI001FAC939F|nr:complement C1s subcomponent-like [Girardinichthys multiradiatus]
MLRLSLLLLLLPCSSYSMLLGWVESPGYPMRYLPHASLNWSRCAPKGQTISIRLIHLDLENSQDCENDAVKILSNGNRIAVLCGKKEYEELQDTVNPLLFSSPGGCLTLLFNSDYSNTKRHTGFKGFYTLQDFNECEDDLNNECTQFCHNFIGGYRCSCRHGYHLAQDKHTCTVNCAKDLSGLKRGDISSPSWPGTYAEHANCKYTLSVEENLQLELHFSEGFDVEQRPDGHCIDELRIETHSETLGPFCGNKPPPSPLLTYSSRVQIHFTSDGFGTNKGFNLNFKTRDKVCRSAVSSNSKVTPLKQEYHRGESVNVTCDLGYEVNSEETEAVLTQYETTCQSTGVWAPSYRCEIVDCGLPYIGADSILQVVDGQNTKYNSQIKFYCSSEYYTLEGNDTYICNASGEWTSVDGNTGMPKCNEVCGMPETDPSSTGRILGGSKAKLGEIPWQLLIKSPKRGGASLINDQWAVTAAHVVEGFRADVFELYGGLIDGQSANISPIRITKIIMHPSYSTVPPSKEQTNFDNDIALIKFTSKVKLGPNLLPICLPEVNRGVSENEQGTVSGWGAAMVNDRKIIKTKFLHYVHIPVYPLAECMNTPYTDSNEAMPFTNNMFCAGGQGMDSCHGDSGGPFVSPFLSSGGPHYLIGIVSWGSNCQNDGGMGKKKGYYTKVENYVNWIKETINKN